jgi:uncharacterized protein YigA (DUF484 family)
VSERAQKSHDAKTEELSDTNVASYLRAHPDFLNCHPEVVSVLTLPALHKGKGVLDLQAFMVERLQSAVAEGSEREDALLTAGRANLVSQGRVHAAVVALLEAHGFAELIETVTTDLAVHLDIDVAALCIEASPGETARASATGIRVVDEGSVDGLIGRGRECLLGQNLADGAEVFGAAATLVRSQALIRVRVRGEGPIGLLALGSRDPDRFHSGQGIELLVFLGATLGLSIRGWLSRGG